MHDSCIQSCVKRPFTLAVHVCDVWLPQSAETQYFARIDGSIRFPVENKPHRSTQLLRDFKDQNFALWSHWFPLYHSIVMSSFFLKKMSVRRIKISSPLRKSEKKRSIVVKIVLNWLESRYKCNIVIASLVGSFESTDHPRLRILQNPFSTIA